MPGSSVAVHHPGEGVPPDLRSGDVLLTSGRHIISRGTQLAQRIRYPKNLSRWSHAAMLTSANGDLVESLEWGPERTHISKYADYMYAVIHIDATDGDRRQMMSFLHRLVADEWAYGYTQILTILFSMLTGTGFSILWDRTIICSAVVALALTRGGYYFDRYAGFVTPADLWQYLVIDNQAKGTK